MDDQVVVIGLGQLGRVFAGGLLRTGHCVFPVNRGDDMDIVAARSSAPALVLVAVAEADLHTVLKNLPPNWRDRLGLLQNELLPRDWLAHGIADPTVISVWFEKKKGSDAKPLLPSPVHGPGAERLAAALASIDLPARVVRDGGQMLWELVRKNLYILTTNLAGLVVGGNVGTLWEKHRDLAEAVAMDVLDLQEALTGHRLDRLDLMEGMLEAFAADPAHACAGRTAPARLARALAHADAAGLAVPTLRQIAARLAAGGF
jgi:ketopantoate reductase